MDWGKVQQLIDASDTSYVNMHLCPGMDMETTGPGDRARLIDAMGRDIGFRVERFGRERIRCGDWPGPWAITLELGGVGRGYERKEDEPILAEQVVRLAEVVESLRVV